MAILPKKQMTCDTCNRVKAKSKFIGRFRKKFNRRSIRSICKACANVKRKHKWINTRLACFAAYGGRVCQCCGEKKLEFLTLDHIGNSRNEMKLRSGIEGYNQLRRLGFPYKSKLRVLCYNCNCSHGFYGYCPHKMSNNNDVERIMVYSNRIFPKVQLRLKQERGNQ